MSTPLDKPTRPPFSKLSPIPSPTLAKNEAVEQDDEHKPNRFSRKLTSSIRRRLSWKAKAGQRFSASDVLDDRRPTPHLQVKDDLAVVRPGVNSNFTQTLGRTEHGGKVKKGFLRKIARNNSMRRRSDSNLNKNITKRPSELDGGTGSHEGITMSV